MDILSNYRLTQSLRRLQRQICCSSGGANIVNLGGGSPDITQLNSIQYDNSGNVFLIDGDGNIIPVGTGSSEIFSVLAGSSWNFNDGLKKTLLLTADSDITITNSVSGASAALLYITQDSTGGWTITINGTELVINAGASEGTLIGIIDVGGGILAFSTNVGASAAPVSLVDINFPTATNLGVGIIVNTSGIWTANGTSGVFGKTGLSNLHLPSGGDGYVRVQNVTGTGNAFIGMLTTNTQPTGYLSFTYGFSVSGGDIYKVDNNGFSGTPVGSVGTDGYVRMNRVGGTVTADTSPDGVVWTPIYTYSITNSGNLYIGTDIYGNNQGKMHYPMGYGLV